MGHPSYLTVRGLLGIETSFTLKAKRSEGVGSEENLHWPAWQLPQGRPACSGKAGLINHRHMWRGSFVATASGDMAAA